MIRGIGRGVKRRMRRGVRLWNRMIMRIGIERVRLVRRLEGMPAGLRAGDIVLMIGILRRGIEVGGGVSCGEAGQKENDDEDDEGGAVFDACMRMCLYDKI
jgi:hypothetical protein